MISTKKGSGSFSRVESEKGSGSFLRVGSGPAAWSEFHGDDEPDPISQKRGQVHFPALDLGRPSALSSTVIMNLTPFRDHR